VTSDDESSAYEIAVSDSGIKETHYLGRPLPNDGQAETLLRLWWLAEKRLASEHPELAQEFGQLSALTALYLIGRHPG